MKVLVIALAVLTLLVGPAMASQCPLLIKQLNEAVGKMKADDAMVQKAKPLIADAQKLHDAGKHADAVKKAEEAAKVLGVKLEMKKM
jgi:hypothetical protein